MSEALKWKVLVVDDEESVHSVTKLALTGFSYSGRQIEFTHAYSGAEAKRAMQDCDDFAVVLLDVVMETDDAGLQVCNFIRNELKNMKVRILLRTGNPGQAPEQEVIMNYEINDYIEKTDLTMSRLINHMVVALRGYRDLTALENTRNGYREMVDASSTVDGTSVPSGFVKGAMRQLAALLYLDESPDASRVFAFGCMNGDQVEVIDTLSKSKGAGAKKDLTQQEVRLVREAVGSSTGVREDAYYATRSKMDSGHVYFLLLSCGTKEMPETDRELVDLFCSRLGRFVERGQG